MLAPLVAGGHPDADTLDLLARARAMRGDMKGAEQELARASALAPNNDDILNRLGAARVELGQTNQGEADLRRSLAQTPDQPRAAAALVQTALGSGDIKGAQEAVDQLRRAAGATEQVGVLDGQVKIAQLDLKGAEAVYLDTLKRFPDSREATLGLVQVESRLGDAKTARDRLTGWMTAHPTDKVGLRMLVTGDMAGRDVSGAIAAVEAAHGAAPADIDVDVALATLYLAAKMPGKAVDLIDRSTEAGGETNPALLPIKGQALIEMGRLPAAEEVLNHAIETAPTDPRPRFGLIELKTNAKDYDGARQLAVQGLEAFPGNKAMQEALVAIDLKAHGIKAALQTADTLKNDPRNLPAALMLPGTALAASGDAPGAARAFVDAYHASPSEQTALTAAAALARAGHQDQGEALLREWTDKHSRRDRRPARAGRRRHHRPSQRRSRRPPCPHSGRGARRCRGAEQHGLDQAADGRRGCGRAPGPARLLPLARGGDPGHAGLDPGHTRRHGAGLAAVAAGGGDEADAADPLSLQLCAGCPVPPARGARGAGQGAGRQARLR